MRARDLVWRGVISGVVRGEEGAVLLLGADGEGDVPDACFLAKVDDVDDFLVGGVRVATEADGLVFVDAGDVGELRLELLRGEGLAVYGGGAVLHDVDDDFTHRAGALGSFGGGGYLDVEVLFVVVDLGGDDEEGEEEEDDINHRCQGDLGGRRGGVLKFHGSA